RIRSFRAALRRAGGRSANSSARVSLVSLTAATSDAPSAGVELLTTTRRLRTGATRSKNGDGTPSPRNRSQRMGETTATGTPPAPLHRPRPRGWIDRAESATGGAGVHTMPNGGSNLTPGSPGDRDRRQAAGNPVHCVGVEEGIGRRMVRLPRRTEGAGNGRE